MRERHTPGVYHLILHLAKPVALRVGRLGRFRFAEGYYVYTGSAMDGLEPRLARHRRRRKKPWWHIDYLLRRAELIAVLGIPTQRRRECERNHRVLSLRGAEIIAPGFGSSDCRCPAHLVYFPRRPNVSLLRG